MQDIDAAIAEVERKEAAVRQKEVDLVARAAQDAKNAREAKALVAEQELLAKRASDIQTAQNLEEKETAQKLAKQRADREIAELKARQIQQEEEALAKSGLAEMWRLWTAKQKSMKEKVIDVVKGDRQIRAGLRVSMRLITRGVGQVVNTREGILRVVGTL